MSKTWRTGTRKHATAKGSKGSSYAFQLSGSSSNAHTIPRMKTYRATTPEIERDVKLAKIPVKDIVWGEKRPVDLEARTAYFVDLYRRGEFVAPILVHRLPSGEYEIIDGHARFEAQKALGQKEILVVENSLTDILKKIGRGARMTAKGIGYVAGLPSGFARAVGEGAAIARGRGEEIVMRRERAIRQMEMRLSQLKRMARSNDPFTRRMAIARLRKEFPEELRELQKASLTLKVPIGMKLKVIRKPHNPVEVQDDTTKEILRRLRPKRTKVGGYYVRRQKYGEPSTKWTYSEPMKMQDAFVERKFWDDQGNYFAHVVNSKRKDAKPIWDRTYMYLAEYGLR